MPHLVVVEWVDRDDLRHGDNFVVSIDPRVMDVLQATHVTLGEALDTWAGLLLREEIELFCNKHPWQPRSRSLERLRQP